MARRVAKQLELSMPTRGGRREGAGRKSTRARASVPHVRRPPFVAAHPVQLTLRVVEGVPSLRERVAWVAIVRTFRALRAVDGFRIVHFSVMTNHLHLLVEADDGDAFTFGMRALTVRLGLRINRALTRSGRLLDHRFHARSLSTPREVFNSLQYVLLNARKHAAQCGLRLPEAWIDPRSSGAVFDGWHAGPLRSVTGDFGTSEARTWLLRSGWRRHGSLRIDAVPGVLVRCAKAEAGSSDRIVAIGEPKRRAA
jgi:REP element-mobilizing transposase RayT